MANAGNLTVTLGLDAAQYTQGLDKAEAATKKLEQSQARASASIDKQIIAMRTQAQVVGFTSDQLRIYELRQKGASDAQLLSAVNILKQNKAFADAQKAISAASDKAKQSANSSAAIDKEVKALVDKVAIQGKSAGAAKLYELAQKGANKAQIDAADAALRQQAAYEAGIKIGNGLKTAIVAVGAAAVTAAIAGAAGFVKIIGHLDDLDEAAQALGTSATALSEYRRAAGESGVAAEQFDTALTKLNVKLVDAAGGGKDSQAAFKALGIEIRNSSGQLKTTDELLGEVANKFATYRDGAEKTALAVELFGRAGARMIPFLNQGAEGLRKLTAVSEENVKAARELQVQFDALKASAEDSATSMAVKLIPFLTKLIGEFNAATTAAGSFTGALKLLIKQSAETLADPGAKIEDLRKKLEDLRATKPMSIGDFIKFGSAEGKASFTSGAIAETERELNFLKQRQRELALINNRADYSNEGRSALGVAPVVPKGTAGDNKAAQLAKKQLDEQLSALDNFIKDEQQLLETRNSQLERLYTQDRISIAAYFSGRSKALSTNVAETIALYDQKIKAEQDYAAANKKSEIIQVEAATKIAELQRKKREVFGKASEDATKDVDTETKATIGYKDALTGLQIKLLELKGTEEAVTEAARKRLEMQNRSNRDKGIAANDPVLSALIDQSERAEIGQARVNARMKEAQTIQERLGTAELKLSTQRDRGYISELDFMAKIGGERRNASLQLLGIADRFTDIANELNDPAMIAAAERFRAELDAMAASADVLANKLRVDFKGAAEDAFAGFFDDLVAGKGLLDSFANAFKAFGNDITRTINRLASQSITDALFKGSSGGSGGGLGTIFSDFFAGMFGQQNLSGVHAGGNDFVQRDGMAYLHRGERVLTAEENRQPLRLGANTIINVQFAGQATAATGAQIGAAAARELAIHNRRNN